MDIQWLSKASIATLMLLLYQAVANLSSSDGIHNLQTNLQLLDDAVYENVISIEVVNTDHRYLEAREQDTSNCDSKNASLSGQLKSALHGDMENYSSSENTTDC